MHGHPTLNNVTLIQISSCVCTVFAVPSPSADPQPFIVPNAAVYWPTFACSGQAPIPLILKVWAIFCCMHAS